MFTAHNIPILVCHRHCSHRAQWLAVKALHNNFITGGQTARLLMGVSITPPLPHPTVSIPTTIKLMCLTERVTTINRIAATAPYRPDRQMILTVRTASRHYRLPMKLCHVTATATAAGSTTTAGPSWQSFVRKRGRRCVCVRSVCATCRVASIGLPVSLAVEQKPSKDDWNKKLNTSYYAVSQKVTLKRGNVLPKMEELQDFGFFKHGLKTWLFSRY